MDKGKVSGLINFEFHIHPHEDQVHDHIITSRIVSNFLQDHAVPISWHWTIVGQNHLHPNRSNMKGIYKQMTVDIKVHPDVRYILVIEKEGVFDNLTKYKLFK